MQNVTGIENDCEEQRRGEMSPGSEILTQYAWDVDTVAWTVSNIVLKNSSE